jgi:formiminoglutamase
MYQAPQSIWWKGRINPEARDLLWHQVVQTLDLSTDDHRDTSKHAYAILGFESDEGVRRNFGRTGAIKGPYEIRSACSGMAFHHDPEVVQVWDAGNVICSDQNLENAAKMLEDKVFSLLAKGLFPIVLGGGHETAFPHFNGV